MTGNDVDGMLADLNDPGYVTWTLPDRLRWINAGVREIITAKPKANTVTELLALTPGTTRQAKPANVIGILDLNVNMGTDGLTPGRHISTVSADRLGASVPGWRTQLGTVVKHLVVDDRDPSAYYVWPGIKSGAWQVEALLEKHPTAITDMGQTLPIDDSYLNPLAAYVMHMAYGRDSENADYASMSIAQYTKFAQILGIQIKQQKRAAPIANTPENPVYPAVDKNAA